MSKKPPLQKKALSYKKMEMMASPKLPRSVKIFIYKLPAIHLQHFGNLKLGNGLHPISVKNRCNRCNRYHKLPRSLIMEGKNNTGGKYKIFTGKAKGQKFCLLKLSKVGQNNLFWRKNCSLKSKINNQDSDFLFCAP